MAVLIKDPTEMDLFWAFFKDSFIDWNGCPC